MPTAPPFSEILLLDDGELDAVAGVLEEMGLAFTRLRGGQIEEDIAPPRDLLIVTPRRLERVRPGSPPESDSGRPLRIVAVQEDSPAMRRRLRRSGLHLLVRLPCEAETWRLLIRRSLYQGEERRTDPRVAVGSKINLNSANPSATTLLDLSNRGCRLQTEEPLAVGDPVAFSITEADHEGASPLHLRGKVRRLVAESGSERITLAVVFDADLDTASRTGLTELINRWAGGPASLGAKPSSAMPTIPACQLPSLPDLILDDETDPPVSGAADVLIEPADASAAPGIPEETDRRSQTRGAYAAPLRAEGESGALVLIGRDLSAGGMRIERHERIALGDTFELALHGPTPGKPFRLHARVSRDDGDDGFGLVFEGIERETAAELEKLVAHLPDVESLEDGEISGLGAILSEVFCGEQDVIRD
ncbi:MAG: PilZ domain-containing protein [Myxococcota bacterium]